MGSDYFALLPQMIVAAAGMLIMLAEPFTAAEHKRRLGQLTVLATAVAAYALLLQWRMEPGAAFFGMFLTDRFTVFFQYLFLIITGVSAMVSMRFNEREGINRGEYYALLLFACNGMTLMAASGDLIQTFLGIEILSIATYILAGFKRDDVKGNESALKYFLLGSFATGFLLYGIALLYGGTGSTNYQIIGQLSRMEGPGQTLGLVGMGLILVGFGFKIATVPFHAWAPDVYEGAPTPVTAFMTVGPKAAGFAALLRILQQALPAFAPDWTLLLWVSAVLTMTLGNIVAVLQTNLKRMLAYSAIAHAGYLLVGFVANSSAGHGAVLFYLVVYSLMNVGALGVVLSLSRKGDHRVNLEDFSGLGRTSPLAAASLSLFLVSLAGIPLTGGFMGKFYLFSAAIQKGYIGLAIIGVLNSVVSVYYYFRVMIYMYMREPFDGQPEPDAIELPVAAILAVSALAVLWLGVFPAQVMNLATHSALALR